MDSVWPAIIAATAAIAASVVTQFFIASREKSKWLSEEKLRWDTTRHGAYAAFAASIKHELRLHVMFAEHRWPGTWIHHATLDYATEAQTLTNAESARANAFEAVILLANPETVSAARRWQSTVWSLRQAHGVEFEGAGQEFMELMALTSPAREEFYRLARADLGLVGELERVQPTPYGGLLRS